MRSRTVAVLAAVSLVVGATLSACRCGGPPPAPPDEPDAAVLALARDVPFAELEVPADSRPHQPEPPARIPLRGWTLAGGTPTVASPIRTRNLYFFKPNVGMRMVRADGTEVPHDYFAGPGTTARWAYDAAHVSVQGWDGLPGDDDLFLEWPLATARERTLNRATSGVRDPADFVRTSIQDGNTARHGLLLPAPATAAWRITVPPRAELRFAAGMVRPEVADGPPSDGATLVFEAEVDGKVRELWRHDLAPDGTWPDVVLDLADLAGRQVVLRARTTPGADARFDYVFVADPTVATHKHRPRRVVMVFVDTLRTDHIGAWGYERDTTPGIDALAGAGVRFANARSVAPWTLPSARTILSGRQPEDWFQARTLQARLADDGFATAMFAGNIYLTANFGITRDWGLHEVDLLPRAEPQVDRALAWLDAQEGRDVFLLLHLMDCHLPYEEPRDYRSRYAQGDLPPGLRGPKFHRQDVLGARLDEAGRQYVRDRYDGSLRYADDQLARLWARLGPDDIVVFLSDHGEEFWDHQGFEHGHALWDELLRVPLVVRAPGLPAGTVVDAPVSLLDVTPTLLDLVGLPTDGVDGTSLVKAAHGDADALGQLSARDQAFGRPLYGRERWGVLHGPLKYQVQSAREEVFDLGEDPHESTPLKHLDTLAPEMRTALGGALGRPVVVAYRVAPKPQRRVEDDLVVRITVPGGVRAVWVGDDPTEASLADVAWDGTSETFTATWPAPYRGTRDVWFAPSAPVAEVTHGLVVHASTGATSAEVPIAADKPADLTPGTRPVLLARQAVGSRELELGFGVTPLPGGGPALSGHSAELADQLAAMGYLTGDKAGERTKDRADDTDPGEAPQR